MSERPLDTRERLYLNLQRKQIPGLNAVRAIAALTVVAAHRLYATAFGTLAVQMFFLLSGLLITWTMLSERERTGSLSLRNFYVRRALRLFPALCALLFVELFVRRPFAPKEAIISSLLYVSNYYVALAGNGVLGGLGHTWSLAVEEHFYLLWPVLFYYWGPRRCFLRMVILATLASALSRPLLTYLVNSNYANYATESNAFAVLAGCALALLIRQSRAARLPRFLLWRPLAALSLAGLLCAPAIPESTAIPWRSAWLPLLAILLLHSITFEWRLLENRCMDFLGRISYSIYLWHMVASEVVLGHGLRGGPRAAALMAAAISFGAASYYAIERPVQNWGRKRFLPKPKSEPVPEPASAARARAATQF